MPLTPQQIAEARRSYGITTDSSSFNIGQKASASKDANKLTGSNLSSFLNDGKIPDTTTPDNGDTVMSRGVNAVKDLFGNLSTKFQERGKKITDSTIKTADELNNTKVDTSHISKQNVIDYLTKSETDNQSNPLEQMSTKYLAPVRNALNTVGQVAGATGDIIAEGLKAGYKTLTPEQRQMKLADGVHSLLNSQGGQAGLEAIGKGLEAYNAWKTNNPKAAEEVESVINVAGLFGGKAAEEVATPVIKKAGEIALEKGVKGAQQLDKVGNKIIDTVKAPFSGTKNPTGIKNFDTVAEVIQPRMTVGEMAGKTTKDVGFGTGKKDIIDHSTDPMMVRAVDAVKGIVKPTATAGTNKNRILKVIADKSENIVRPFLTENKVPFNFQNLRDSFELVQPKSFLKSNPEAYNTYNRVREELLSTIEGHLRNNSDHLNETDLNDLWDARKKVDHKITEELNANLGEAHYAGAKAAAQDFRQQMAQFIDKSLEFPGQMEQINKMESFVKELRNRGMRISNEKEYMDAIRKQFGITNTTADMARKAFFRDQMDTMSAMYHAVDNLSTNIKRDLGKSKIGRYFERHPVQKDVLKYGTGVGIGGAAVNELTK